MLDLLIPMDISSLFSYELSFCHFWSANPTVCKGDGCSSVGIASLFLSLYVSEHAGFNWGPQSTSNTTEFELHNLRGLFQSKWCWDYIPWEVKLFHSHPFHDPKKLSWKGELVLICSFLRFSQSGVLWDILGLLFYCFWCSLGWLCWAPSSLRVVSGVFKRRTEGATHLYDPSHWKLGKFMSLSHTVIHLLCLKLAGCSELLISSTSVLFKEKQTPLEWHSSHSCHPWVSVWAAGLEQPADIWMGEGGERNAPLSLLKNVPLSCFFLHGIEWEHAIHFSSKAAEWTWK